MYTNPAIRKKESEMMFSLSKVLDGIYHLSFDTTINLGSYFLRYQEYYESPKFCNTPFQLIDFIKWYSEQKEGDFTYFTDWSGFNIPVGIITELYPKLTDANDHDDFMYLIAKILLKENDKAYLIGTSQENKKNPSQNFAFDHEIAHGLFYMNDEYKDNMQRLVKKIPNAERLELFRVLTELGYHEHVLIDEAQAYLATGLTEQMEQIQIPAKVIIPFKKMFYKFYHSPPDDISASE